MDIAWFLALFALIVIGIIANGLHEPLTPNLYVFNTYLYILLALIVVATTWRIGDNLSYDNYAFDSNGYHLLGLFIVSLLFIFSTVLSTNKIVTHAAWFLFVVCIGLITYVQYKISKENGKLPMIFLSLVTLIGILSWISLTQPLDTFDSWFRPMMMILVGLIVVQLIDLAFFAEPGEKFLTRFRIYSWIGLILFSGFMLYDTQKLIKNGIRVSAQCDPRKHFECTNYPAESLNIFMDIVNLFSSTSSIANN